MEVEHAEAAAEQRLTCAEQVVRGPHARRPEDRLHVDAGRRNVAVARRPRHPRERRTGRRAVVQSWIEHGHAGPVSFGPAAEVRHAQTILERQPVLRLPAVLRVHLEDVVGHVADDVRRLLAVFREGSGQQIREVVAARSGCPVAEDQSSVRVAVPRLAVVHPFVIRTRLHRVRPGDLRDALRARDQPLLGEEHRIEAARVVKRRSVSPRRHRRDLIEPALVNPTVCIPECGTGDPAWIAELVGEIDIRRRKRRFSRDRRSEDARQTQRP